MHPHPYLMSLALVLCWATQATAIDPYRGNDPYWILLHEPAVLKELKLTADQQAALRQRLDPLDLRFFALRNKPQQEAQAGAAKIISEAHALMDSLLSPARNKRLSEMLLQRNGVGGLLDDGLAKQLRQTAEQRQRIAEIVEETRAAIAEIEQELSAGKPREQLDKRFTEVKRNEYQQVQDLLEPEQRSAWQKMLGAPFDLAQLGRPAFKAPELIDTGDWINSRPLQLKDLQGKVVVLHFYAFGCINCIRNYPAYRAWHERFKEQGVVVMGIHTPETASERESENVRRKSVEEKFAFPVLIDGKNENWNAWGNSMWPSVYLIDKEGYLRHFWPGELNWQGAKGEEYMRQQIESLVGEK